MPSSTTPTSPSGAPGSTIRWHCRRAAGALRLWLGFAGKQLVSATADVRLADVRLQLRPDLPELDLISWKAASPGAASMAASKPNSST
jgi:hypothetical protein